ncbi:zinc-ribbon domain-containing protein [Roseivivax sp. CAU 1761]
MRLTCPNCHALYDVPAELIPAEGRDVECSDCGETWFQPPETGAAEEPAPEPAAPAGPAEAPEAVPEAAVPAPPAAAGDPAAPPVPPAPRRNLDPEVAEVLRQERDYETRRRAAAAEVLETQTEFGFEATRPTPRPAPDPGSGDAAAPADAAEDRTAAIPEIRPALTPAATGSRRDLLPDIDEINQTLRSEDERRPVETVQGRAAIDEERARDRVEFGHAFALALGVGAVLIALYAVSPALAQALPFLEGPLGAYGAAVDGGRAWLDGRVGAALAALDLPGPGIYGSN